MMHYSTAFTASSLFLAISAALIVPRATPPANWPRNLESWHLYHARHSDLGCDTQQHTSFFDKCCKPLPAHHTLPAQCKDGNDDEDCNGDESTPDLKTGGITDGYITFYYQHHTAGACGTVHSDKDLIAAMETETYNNGAVCGKKVSITNHDTQQTVVVTIADECPDCNNPHSIDLSVAAFSTIADVNIGLLHNVTWFYV